MAAPYRIYMVRHAIAADRGPEYPDDSKRPLTPRGVRKFRDVARGLAALDPDLHIILSSPFARARQTAEILAEALPGSLEIVETEAMTPEASYAQFLDELAARAAGESVAVVGHEPSISAFAARLIGAKGIIEFKKGGMALIEVDGLPPAQTGRLVWLLPPRVLAALGK